MCHMGRVDYGNFDSMTAEHQLRDLLAAEARRCTDAREGAGTDRACYRQALAAQPNLAEGHFRVGNALTRQGKFDEAFVAYRQAIGIKPDFAAAHSNLGL